MYINLKKTLRDIARRLPECREPTQRELRQAYDTVLRLRSQVLAALPLPEALSLWNGRFFTAYPLTLGTLDPAFALPAGAAAAQAALLALGAALLAAGGSRRKAIR